jgi:uncharacterized membrane protein required for colicin V production
MTSGRNIRAGRAFVEIGADDKQLVNALRQAERRLSTFGKGLIRVGTIALAAGAAFTPFGIAVVKAASDSEEALSRFAAVFKDQTEDAARFAETLADRIGRSSLQIKDALGVFQSFFVGLGFNNGTSRQLSQQLTSLALDFASFNNISDEEAIQRFISALSGSGEVLDRFGINIKQAALQQQLLADGVNKAWTEVTEQEKAIARLNIIMRTMTDQGSVGDATRTAGSFSNVMKRLKGEIRDTAVAIGQGLVPVLKPVVTALGTGLGVVRQLAQANTGLITGVFLTIVGVASLGAVVLGAGLGVALLSVAMGGLAAALVFVQGVAAPVIVALGGLLVVTGLVVTAVGALGLAFGGFAGTARTALLLVLNAVNQFSASLIPALGAVRDALTSGDIVGAARVLWASLGVVWERGSNLLLTIVAEVAISIVGIFEAAFMAIEFAFAQVGKRITTSLGNLVDQLTGTVAGTVLAIGFNTGVGTLLDGGENVANQLQILLDLLKDGSNDRVRDAEKRLNEEIERARQSTEQARAAQLEAFNIDLGGIADQVRNTIETAGSFGGRVIERQFGGNSAAREQLVEARKTTKNTGDTAQAVGNLAARLVFT